MEDRCIFCGSDVSDLGDHICKRCSSRNQIDLLSRKLTAYRYKLDRVQRHSMTYAMKLGKLRWFQYIQRNYLEKILQMYGDMMQEYQEIITILELKLKHEGYKSIGGNAEVKKVETELRQSTSSEEN